MKPIILLTIITILSLNSAFAQINDSIKINSLDAIEINGSNSISERDFVPTIKDNIIYAGKKVEMINLTKSMADLSTNQSRQIYAKIPGITIWESDGSGIQQSVASRGLSPNRSWEFNTRMNGYDISADPYGYPEAYFSPPTEALEKVEVIRGASSLQFGPQFGGLLNYVVKKGNTEKPIAFESQQTIGNYNLFNTYNSLSGTVGKLTYNTYMHNRSSEGWRQNSKYNTLTAFGSLSYKLCEKLELNAEYTNMTFKSQQPGGLTDAQFSEDAQKSSRSRNWLMIPWNVASVGLNYKVSDDFSIQIKAFTTISERSSVGYMKAINLKDSINPKTDNYATRQIDRDFYENYGGELRASNHYNLLGKKHSVAGGIRYFSGSTRKLLQGNGTSGTEYSLHMNTSEYGRKLYYNTDNYAVFAENIFYIGEKLKVVPGIRYENIVNTVSGYLNLTATGSVNPEKRTRSIFLYGIGSEYSLTKSTTLYGNYSLAYRPVTFSELTPSATTEIVDPNLKDANGFNADFGYKGSIEKYLNFDVSAFYVLYNNRVGTIIENGAPFKTNIGTSVSKGVEAYLETDILKLVDTESAYGNLNLFATLSFIDAQYTRWNNPAILGDPIKTIEGKRVENAPQYIHRLGATYKYKGFYANYQFNMIGDVYTDAANTELPNAAATTGKISGYEVMDASLGYTINKNYTIKVGVNNLTDERYATRRAGGYPGPGLLPGNGRTYFFTLGIKL